MSRIAAKVPPFDYLKGREFTEKLKEVTGCKTYELMSDYFGVPNSTFSTWHTHNRTGWELIIRTHLATGASVRYLALGEGKPFESGESNTLTSEELQIFKLVDGALVEAGNTAIDLVTLDRFGLKPSITQVIEDDSGIYYINKASTDPVAGDYLIDIDGRLSINYLQRLPGKKLAIAFGNSTIEVSEEDIKVLGRVAMEMKKK
ncbi:phage repressor protein CI [Vibrio parahaemolyticus]|uniref:CI repressor n=1 Tax=Vibrio phage vB_ValM-yong1 TaxID=2660715 RepID=A0A6M3A3B3_9CAUD|nr:phage repressor protein CI [Vibrio parahaemolyticus]YP_009885037.1 repressor protein CI [Vibrio phage Valm-yong1]HCZ9306351.1 phage repressor protein CI [Vibrio alginolyticus]MBM5118010.1 phage repressor protein CI [Vibrio parahaemolyticus]MBM5121388.1 phage repressor protein CI [Vibrio parahaemolyticus]MBM5131801.1 phage repressor protein CI [Vibrio parahaemolyticus]MBM5138614.1 phage repressor protein CI [Vibrio parahaemolyticus]